VGPHRTPSGSAGSGATSSHYSQPYVALTPINIIEEITKADHHDVSTSLRNLFSGGLMIAVMTTLAAIYVVPFGEIFWKLFDLGILARSSVHLHAARDALLRMATKPSRRAGGVVQVSH